MTETTSRVGRPEVGPKFSVQLPAQLVDALDRWAASRSTTRAELIRHACWALMQAEAGMVPATAASPSGMPSQHRPAIGDRVALWRRDEVSGYTGTSHSWHIGPVAEASDGPLGPTVAEAAGGTRQIVGWGVGTVRDIYPHRDLPTYIVEPDD